MPTLTGTSAIPRVRAAFDRRLLDRLLPNLVHQVGAERRPLSLRSGDQIKFRRFESLAANAVPLAEGVTSGGTYLDDTQLTSSISQYGDYVILTDRAVKTDETALLAESVDLLAEQAEKSMDTVIRDVVNAGTYYLRCDGASTYSSSGARAVVDNIINLESLKAAVRQLELYDVKKFRNPIKAGTGVGSLPIPESYIGITHPRVLYTLRGLSGWIDVHEYATAMDLLPGEVGAYDWGIRFCSTTNAKVWPSEGNTGTSGYVSTDASHADVFSTLVFGKGFYATTDLDGGIKSIIQDFGSGGSTDPMKQRATVAWQADFVTTILNDYCGVRIEAGALV